MLEKVKDLMEMSYEAYKESDGNKIKHEELFCKMLLEEFSKLKGEDIAQHLSCEFDLIKQEYRVELRIPVSFHIMNPGKCYVK